MRSIVFHRGENARLEDATSVQLFLKKEWELSNSKLFAETILNPDAAKKWYCLQFNAIFDQWIHFNYTGCTLKLHISSAKKEYLKRPKMTKSNLTVHGRVHNEKNSPSKKFSNFTVFTAYSCFEWQEYFLLVYFVVKN